MARARIDVFQVALAQLRGRLRDGAYAPGSRITAVDVADALHLSATPVREALSRLAGEGVLIDRRGQGFFVRQLTAPDIADLYRLSLAKVMIALDPHRRGRAEVRSGPGPAEAGALADDPVRLADAVLVSWVAAAGSPALVANLQRVQGQLALVRGREPRIFPDLPAEAAALAALMEVAAVSDRLAAARRWHLRRIRNAHELAALLEPEGRNNTL